MTLTLDDLIKRCAACDGTGKLEDVPRLGFSETCRECKGAGQELTPTGEAIKEFFLFLQKQHPG